MVVVMETLMAKVAAEVVTAPPWGLEMGMRLPARRTVEMPVPAITIAAITIGDRFIALSPPADKS
jgi:hypothetical protein